MLLKYCTQYVSKSGKASFHSISKEGKLQRMFNVLYSWAHMLVRLCSKSFKLSFNSAWTENFQMYKLDLEMTGEPTFVASLRKQESSRKTSTSASLTTLKPLTMWITTNCGKILQRWEYQTTLPVPGETCLWVKKEQLEPDMEQLTDSKLGKAISNYGKALYCHPAYLTYLQSASCKIPGWMNHNSVQFSSVAVWLFATHRLHAACQTSLSITNSQSLLKVMSIESVMPSNHLIFCHPLLLLPSIFPSMKVFSKESVLCTRWPKYWSFNFSISPSNEYSGLTFFRIDRFDILAVQ